MQIKAVLHDWDDTVTSSVATYKRWYYEFATAHNFPFPDETIIREHWGKPVHFILSQLWEGLCEKDAELLLNKFLPSQVYVPPMFEGVADTLMTLKERGLLLGVITSGRRREIAEKYFSYFQSPLHTMVLCKEDCQFHKPDPRVFDEALSSLQSSYGIEPLEVLYVGDSIFDYHAARGRGLYFLAVTTGIHSERDFISAGLPSEYILEDFTCLPGYLEMEDSEILER